MAPEDLLSPALREAERAIDEQYASNPLVNYPRAYALWAFLAACAEHFVRQAIWEFEAPQKFGVNPGTPYGFYRFFLGLPPFCRVKILHQN